MKTQQPLENMVSDLANHILQHQDYLRFNKRVLNIFEGQLKTEIEAELAVELSPQSFERARHRIPSFNLLARITNKLSKVYMKPATRTSKVNKQQLEDWQKWTRFDDKMRQVNLMLNLHKIVATEPYIQEGKPKIRVIPAHQFLPYSDSPFDPTDMTVFIKFLGTTLINNPFTNSDGELSDPDEMLEVGKYIAYSDEEILTFEVGFKSQVHMAIESVRPNPIGKIPQTLISRSDYRLIPIPDSDSLNNTILIPKMYANLAYAVKLQAHGVLAAIDLSVDPSELRKSPDVLWDFKTDSDSDVQGRLESVKVEIDIEEVNNLVQNILSIWLETRNVRAGSSGKASEQRASGAAKIIDQADASEDIDIQKGILSNAEKDIWDTIRILNNHSIDVIDPKLNPKHISDMFDVDVSFPITRPAGTPMDQIGYVREKMSLGLMSRKQAIKELHPEFSSDQIDDWLEEASSDEEFLEGIGSGAGGQFSTGNQEANTTSTVPENLENASKESE